MKFGIFSDIHSNLESLKAVLDELKKQDADKYIFLGDFVGYNSSPNECIDLIKNNFILEGRNQNFFAVLGNHDARCFGHEMGTFFKEAAIAVEWTKRELAPQKLEFLKSFLLVQKIENFFICHGSPASPPAMEYLKTLGEARKNFKFFKEKICFFGHTHVPEIYSSRGGKVSGIPFSGKIAIKPDVRYLINAGSTGQPRDGDRRASCCIYDEAAKLVEIFRVEYDFRITQEKNSKAGLPAYLNKRLEKAR